MSRSDHDESDVSHPGSAVSESDLIVPAPAAEPLKLVNLNPAYRRFFGKIPQTVLSVPSMMSVAEKRFLYGLASNYYAGEGLIIDAGIFLAASSRCFGEGLQANPHRAKAVALRRRPVISFEKGDVNPGMPAFFERNGVKLDVKVGGSFIDAVKENIKPVQDLVELRHGDITKTAEDLDDPIEICFLDVLKLPDISAYCLRKFFPRLIPGRSIVIQQDYFYERLPYIKTHQEHLRESFEFIGEIGSTAVFLCTKPVAPEKLKELTGGISADEQLRLASIATQRSHDPSRRFLMSLSKLRLIKKLKGIDAARQYLDHVKGEFPEQIENKRQRRIWESLRDVEELCGSSTED